MPRFCPSDERREPGSTPPANFFLNDRPAQPRIPAATTRAQAAGIRVPYQMHHGDIDNTVPLSHDQRLDSILAAHRVTRDLRTYTGFDHGDIPLDAVMLGRVKTWYAAHGVLDPVATRSAVPVLRNPAVRPGKQETARRNLLGRKVGAEGRRPD